MKTIAALVGLCAFSLALASPAAADAVTGEMTVAQVIQAADGTERLAPAERVSPGETLQYALTYANRTEDPLEGFMVVGPVPEGTDFVAGSASSSLQATLEAQVAELGWSAVPVMREEILPDGTVGRVEVPPSEYQALRWRVDGAVAPGLTVEATYRVRVED